MVAKLRIAVDELSTNFVDVKAKEGEFTLAPGQTRTVTLEGLALREADPVPPETTSQPDVFHHQNPNGISRAEISAKLPKAGGETQQEITEDGRIIERSVDQDQALAVAAGGPEGAEEGRTPGPQVQQGTTIFAGGPTGAETGDVDKSGAPLARTNETVEKTATGKAPSAKK